MGTELQHDAWDGSWENVPDTLTTPTGWFLLDSIKLEKLVSLLPSGGTVLEVGCGSARLSAFLAEKGYKVTGLDYSEKALDVAVRNFHSLGMEANILPSDEAGADFDPSVGHYFIKGDATDLPFASDTFDIVISTGLLEHFEDPSNVVNEMARIIKPGGLFYSDVVPKKFSSFRISSLWRPFTVNGEEVYEGAFRTRHIRQWIDDSGMLEEPKILAAGVLPPQRFTARPEWCRKLVFKLRPFWSWLEGGMVARLLGCYYFVYSWKKRA